MKTFKLNTLRERRQAKSEIGITGIFRVGISDMQTILNLPVTGFGNGKRGVTNLPFPILPFTISAFLENVYFVYVRKFFSSASREKEVRTYAVFFAYVRSGKRTK